MAPGCWRLRTKLLLLIVALAALSVALFVGLWQQQNNVATLLERAGLVKWFDSEAFTEKARALAPDYSVPPYYESDEGVNDPSVIAFQPYCDALADEFTGVYVYGLDDGLYRASSAADIVTRSWFNTLWTLEFKMLGEEIYEIPVEFANGTYLVHVFSYHRILLTYPYLVFCLLVSITVFFGGILIFVRRMTRRIHLVEGAILQMGSGDLTTAVPACGGDEIGIVARELDTMRKTLAENLEREKEAQTANRDLITALSHDLRTPLTVLTGYLEVLKHAHPEDQGRYVDRCLQKADDIRLLTDRLFDAALVEETIAVAALQKLPFSVFSDCLHDNIDFLHTCGFRTDCRLIDKAGDCFADPIMLRRMFDNLFSNIIKYGDKGTAVAITLESDGTQLRLTLKNAILDTAAESNHIGLRNVQHMIAQHGGSLETHSDDAVFTAVLSLPLAQ